MKMDDKMYLTVTAQGEVSGRGEQAEDKWANVCTGLEGILDFSAYSASFMA